MYFISLKTYVLHVNTDKPLKVFMKWRMANKGWLLPESHIKCIFTIEKTWGILYKNTHSYSYPILRTSIKLWSQSWREAGRLLTNLKRVQSKLSFTFILSHLLYSRNMKCKHITSKQTWFLAWDRNDGIHSISLGTSNDILRL